MALIFGDSLIVYDVPTIKVRVGKTVKRRVDGKSLAAIVRRLSRYDIDHALTENVNGWSRPKRKGARGADEHAPDGQSASAAFAFGVVAGKLEQALDDNGVEWNAVSPAAWKRALGLIGQNKGASRALASKVFPSHAHLFARVKDDGRAEAALLAHYAKVRRL